MVERTIREVADLCRFGVRLGARSLHASERIAASLGIALANGPGTIASGPIQALWLSPGQWLIVGPRSEHATLEACLRAATADVTALVADMSDACVTVELEDADLDDVIASSATLPASARPAQGEYALPTAFASIPVILHRRAPGRCWLHVDRSLGFYLREWLRGISSRSGTASSSTGVT